LLQVETLFGPDPHNVARVVAPFGFAYIVGIFAFSCALDLIGRAREPLLLAAILTTAGVGAMVAVNPNAQPMATGLSVLAGVGIGGVFIPPVILLTIATPDDLIGTIVGLGLTIRWIGGQIAYTIYYHIFITKVTSILPANVGLAAAKAGLPITEIVAFVEALVAGNYTEAAHLKGVTPTILAMGETALKDSFDEGFKLVFYASIGFGGASIIASLFLGTIRKYASRPAAVDIH